MEHSLEKQLEKLESNVQQVNSLAGVLGNGGSRITRASTKPVAGKVERDRCRDGSGSGKYEIPGRLICNCHLLQTMANKSTDDTRYRLSKRLAK